MTETKEEEEEDLNINFLKNQLDEICYWKVDINVAIGALRLLL